MSSKAPVDPIPEDYLKRLGSYLGVDLIQPKLRELKPFVGAIEEFSEGLNKSQSRSDFLAKTYLDRDAFRKAYLLYYTTTNLLKIHSPLTELSRSGFFSKPRRVMDLGTGTGTAILGMNLWLDKHQSTTVSFTGSDVSNAALDEFRRFYDHAGFSRDLSLENLDLGRPGSLDGTFDLITGSNVLNELTEDGERHIVELAEKNLIESGALLLIEPALKETARRLMKFRDAMIERGWFVYAPCFTQNPCPMLSDAGAWCHHVMPWVRPRFIEILDEAVGHIRKSLKYSYLILTRSDVHASDFMFAGRDFRNQFRAVSGLFDEKGRSRVFLCNEHGWCEAQRNDRDRSGENADFDALERYDAVQIEAATVDPKNRIRVGKNTKVRKVRTGGSE